MKNIENISDETFVNNLDSWPSNTLQFSTKFVCFEDHFCCWLNSILIFEQNWIMIDWQIESQLEVLSNLSQSEDDQGIADFPALFFGIFTKQSDELGNQVGQGPISFAMYSKA